MFMVYCPQVSKLPAECGLKRVGVAMKIKYWRLTQYNYDTWQVIGAMPLVKLATKTFEYFASPLQNTCVCVK